MAFSEAEANRVRIKSLGPFEALDVRFDRVDVLREIALASPQDWHYYNKGKPGYNRYGLSLVSLDGSTSGEIDLTSTKEYNLKNGTQYDEQSFRTKTKYWDVNGSVSRPLFDISEDLCRSHLIKLNMAGIFPPHRDLGESFRLISFFNCGPNSLQFVLNDKVQKFEPYRLYVVDTERVHSLVSFQEEALILVLNVHSSKNAVDFVIKNLRER